MITSSLTPPKTRRFLIFALLAAAVFLVALVQLLNTTISQSSFTSAASSRTAAERDIETLQAKLQRQPENPTLYAELGLAYLQRVRETGDSSYYTLADKALQEALTRDPDQPYALIGQGTLALARHDFTEALTWGKRAQALNAFSIEPLAILTDGYIELGRYEEAAATLQQLVDLKPGLAAYTRISYLRELHGDVDGAIEAMSQAAAIGVPGQEATLWTKVQLGHLYFNRGDFDQAEAFYNEALYYDPHYPYALAGLGRVQAARGDYAQALGTYIPLVQRYPLPEFVIELGDLYTQTGQTELAQRQYDLVYLIQELNASAGMDVDLEMALFAADHLAAAHAPSTAELVAQATAAYERRPSIEAADVLAWTLYQHGDYEAAWSYSQEALRLHTQNARYHYHAGRIAYALGRLDAARNHLQTALDINPAFSVLHAAEAEQLLAELSE